MARIFLLGTVLIAGLSEEGHVEERVVEVDEAVIEEQVERLRRVLEEETDENDDDDEEADENEEPNDEVDDEVDLVEEVEIDEEEEVPEIDRSSLGDAVSYESLLFLVVSTFVLYSIEWFIRNSKIVENALRMEKFDDKDWDKFKMQIQKFIWHGLNTLALWWVIADLGLLKESLWPLGNTMGIYWNAWDYGFSRPKPVTYIFLIQFAHYVSNSLYWITVEAEKEFLLMVVHHILTATLLTCCNMGNRMWMGGFIILAVTETTDAVLSGVKIVHYAFNMSKALLLFAVVWTYFRMVWFLTMLYDLWSHADEVFGITAIPGDFGYMGVDWLPASRPAREYVFTACLITLFQCLHFIWFQQLVKSVYTSIVSGQLVDSRNDEEAYERVAQAGGGTSCVKKTVNKATGCLKKEHED